MRLFVFHVVTTDDHAEIVRNTQRFKERSNKWRRLVGDQRQRETFFVQCSQRMGHIREQKTALFHRLSVVAVKQLTQHHGLLFLRNIRMVNRRFTGRSALRVALLQRPGQSA